MTTKNFPLKWPPESEREINLNNSGIMISEQIFGALSQDSENPLSRVSAANSSFSLDPFRGCPARCAYCTVAGASRDIIILQSSNDHHLNVQLPSKPERLFSGDQLAQALMSHPAFIKHKSVISIGTGSTEAFLPEVEKETWNIMNEFLRRGYKNPFWIVTKLSIPDQFATSWSNRFHTLIDNDIKVLLSVTYSGAPPWVEPYQGNRFRNMDLMKSSGVKISLHLRPIIQGINDSEECLATALDSALGIVEAICVGGLRRDPGVELAWKDVYKLDPALLPSADSREKDIPEGYIERVKEYLARKSRVNLPIVTKSSEVLSYLLEIPEYNLYKYRPDDKKCFLSVSKDKQLSIQANFRQSITDIIGHISQNIGLYDVKAKINNNEISLNRQLSYQEHRTLIHAIGHANIF